MNRRRFWIAVQAIVSVMLLALLLRGLDLAAFRALFARVPAWFYVTSLLVVLAAQFVFAWRWRLVLVAVGLRVPYALIVRQYFIGIFLNNFLPSTVGGDLAKVYLLGRDYGYRTVTASVLLDRMLGLGLQTMFTATLLWSVTITAPIFIAARFVVTALAIAAIVALVLVAGGTGGLPRRVAWLGPKAIDLASRLQRLRSEMALSLTNPLLIAQAAAVVAGYFLAIGVLYVTFIELQSGSAPPVAPTLSAVMAALLLSNIPVSLNGLGLREQLHASLLGVLGVAPEVAVGVSLLFYAHLLIAALIGLVFWLQIRVAPEIRLSPDADHGRPIV